MSSEKIVLQHGLLGKAESTYGGGGSLSASTDGIWTREEVVIDPMYLFDGSRAPSPGTGGPMPRNTPRGRYAQGIRIPIVGRGAGAAYHNTGPVVPADLDILLRSTGRLRTITNDTKAAYALTNAKANWVSAVLGGYAHEELVSLIGFYSSMGYTIDGMGEWLFEFSGSAGISAVPSDQAVPTITYQNPGTLPIVTDAITITLGLYLVAKLRRATYSDGRQITGPFRRASGGVGFGLSRYDPRLKVLIEATPMPGSPYNATTGLQPYELYERRTALAVSIDAGTGGASNWNRIKHSLAQAQISAPPKKVNDDGVACWEIEFQGPQSAPAAEDADIIEFL